MDGLVNDCRFGVSPVNYPDPGALRQFFSKHLGFSDIDEVKNRNAHSSLSCAWHKCLEPKETFKAGQKVMVLGSKIAFILIQWRYFSKGLYIFFRL